MVFAIFSVLVEANATIVIGFAAAGLTITASIFLTIELNTPFGGFLELSGAQAPAVYNGLGR